MARLDPTSPSVLGASLAALGSTLLLVGGGGTPGALHLLPGHDGALVGSVLALVLLLVHGHGYRFAVLAAAPIAAIAAAGFVVGHPRPLAPIGLQLALYGAIGIATALLRGGAPRTSAAAEPVRAAARAPAPREEPAPRQEPESVPRTTASRIAIDECSRFSA